MHFIRSANKLAKCLKAADKVIRKFYRLCFAERNILVRVKYENSSDAQLRLQDSLYLGLYELDVINGVGFIWNSERRAEQYVKQQRIRKSIAEKIKHMNFRFQEVKQAFLEDSVSTLINC